MRSGSICERLEQSNFWAPDFSIHPAILDMVARLMKIMDDHSKKSREVQT